MRLDHLLSKERLAGESRPVARAARLWWWGAHMAETLVSYLLATAGEPSTQVLTFSRVCGGVGVPGGAGVRCGWWMMMSTLLSPERTTGVVPGGGLPRNDGWLFFLQAWP